MPNEILQVQAKEDHELTKIKEISAIFRQDMV